MPTPIQTAERTTSANMLDTLLALQPNQKDKALTHVAIKCFEDIQNLNLGFKHAVCKRGGQAAIFAGGLAASYFALNLAYNYATSSIYNSLTLDNLNIDTIYKVGALVATTLTTEIATRIATGKSQATWITYAAGAAMLFGTKMVSDSWKGSYEQVEQQVKEKQMKLHDAILIDLTRTYNGVAAQVDRLREKALNSPKAMCELKEVVRILESKFTLIESAFASVNVSQGESALVLNTLRKVMSLVENHKFTLMPTKSSGKNSHIANKSNAELMDVLTPRAFAESCIPNDVSVHLQKAEDNTLGRMHTVKKWTKSLGEATGITVASLGISALAVSIFKDMPLSASKVCGFTAAAGAAITGARAGYVFGQRVFNRMTEERQVCDANKAAHSAAATEKLTNIYNGIADYMSKQLSRAGINEKALKQLKTQAQKCKVKLDLAKVQIAKHPQFQEPTAITAKLEGVLKEIAAAKSEPGVVKRAPFVQEQGPLTESNSAAAAA